MAKFIVLTEWSSGKGVALNVDRILWVRAGSPSKASANVPSANTTLRLQIDGERQLEVLPVRKHPSDNEYAFDPEYALTAFAARVKNLGLKD